MKTRTAQQPESSPPVVGTIGASGSKPAAGAVGASAPAHENGLDGSASPRTRSGHRHNSHRASKDDEVSFT